MADAHKLTLVEIARRANVSWKTVSRVVNRKPGGVSADKRAEIEAIIAAEGYRPNAAARALSRSKNHLIGLFLEQAESHYYLLDLQFGASDASLAQGYHLVIESVAGPVTDLGLERYAERIVQLGIDGAIVAPPASDDLALLDLFDRLNLPYVRISPGVDVTRSASVRIDDVAAGHDMTQYLWQQGHRDIAFIQDHPGVRAGEDRKAGYLKALLSHEVTPALGFIEDGERPGNIGFVSAERLLGLAKRPTAIFAANDEIAFGAMAACAKAGLKLPRDLSLAGFNDAPGAHSVWPPLTTVHQPAHEIGVTAVRMLLGLLGGQARDTWPHEVLPYRIVERASVAPYPGG